VSSSITIAAGGEFIPWLEMIQPKIGLQIRRTQVVYQKIDGIFRYD
jgi:hypothetical protein